MLLALPDPSAVLSACGRCGALLIADAEFNATITMTAPSRQAPLLAVALSWLTGRNNNKNNTNKSEVRKHGRTCKDFGVWGHNL
jgi:hypothetical protein